MRDNHNLKPQKATISSSDFSDVIKNRRSIREYRSEKISEASVLRIMRSATWAPSAHDAQPWRFIVVTDRDTKRRLAEAMAQTWDADLLRDSVSLEERKKAVASSTSRFANAPMLVVACISMKDMHRYADERRRGFEYLLATQSLASAIENMLLAAHVEGLGSCWYCAPLFCQEEVRKVLSVPSNVDPQALVTLGKPAEHPKATSRKASEEVVFKNRWGERF